MGNYRIENETLIYRKLLKQHRLPLSDIRWAYLQQEDVSAKMCCGSFDTEIGRVILLKTDGKKEVFQFEGMEPARDLLFLIKEAKPELPIGYTQENRALYETKK